MGSAQAEDVLVAGTEASLPPSDVRAHNSRGATLDPEQGQTRTVCTRQNELDSKGLF